MRINSIKLLCLFFTSILIMVLTGCSINADKEFNLSTIEKAPDGFYVLDSQGTCYPLLRPELNLSGGDLLTQTLNGNEATFLVTQKDMERVPVLGENTTLIAKASSELSEVLPFFPLTDLGYTLGIVLEKTNEVNVYTVSSSPGSVSPGSSAETEFIKDVKNQGDLKILSISGQALNENLIEKTGTVKNLQKDRMYELEALEGTKKYDVNIKADTCVLTSDTGEILKLNLDQFSDQGFAVFSLGDVKEGYYFLNGMNGTSGGGILYYDPE